MKNDNRERIHQTVHLKDIFDICLQIQNAGIGTVFCDFSGHVNTIYVRVFTPVWFVGGEPSFEKRALVRDTAESQAKLEDLYTDLAIILRTSERIEDVDAYVANQLREQKRKEYEALKAEFEPQPENV